MYGNDDWSAQFGVQVFIVLIAIICVFWMLLSKPYILYQRSKKKRHPGVCEVFYLPIWRLVYLDVTLHFKSEVSDSENFHRLWF